MGGLEKEESLVTQQRRFLAYAAPTCMLIVSPFGLSFVSIMFAGWQNKELLSGVALGNTTYNIFLMSVMCGFCSLLSTYGPQVIIFVSLLNYSCLYDFVIRIN